MASKKGKDEILKISQWNGRSIQRKKQKLLQFTCVHQPDVIALQEMETDKLKFRGFETHIAEGRRRTAILTKQEHTTQQHYNNHRTEHTLVEVIPGMKTLQYLVILNVFNPPSETLNDFYRLLKAVKKITKGPKLIAKITDGTAFRKPGIPDLQDIENWTKRIVEIGEKPTKTTQLSVENPEVV
ncbi:hypothetical protein HPB49_012593 [Dermacentor silvarum]|uniref:Uncharacterized protein n=1 Tax=Dermacentor silvarum TaxID=543639 RepID=A0ACB8E0H1_DERSI|nr:hypothetical protein HPB49_012593 [Dermacentor silvarum]